MATPVDKVVKLKPTNHAIFVDDSFKEKHLTSFSFSDAGLRNSEAGIYMASEEPPEIKTAMKMHGIAVEKYEKTGALKILSYTDVYIVDGKFSIGTLRFWKKEFYKARSKFKGLRVTGEMSCFFEKGLEAELLSCETSLHRILGIPMVALCAYNLEDLQKSENSIDLYTSLIEAYAHAIFTLSNYNRPAHAD